MQISGTNTIRSELEFRIPRPLSETLKPMDIVINMQDERTKFKEEKEINQLNIKNKTLVW